MPNSTKTKYTNKDVKQKDACLAVQVKVLDLCRTRRRPVRAPRKEALCAEVAVVCKLVGVAEVASNVPGQGQSCCVAGLATKLKTMVLDVDVDQYCK